MDEEEHEERIERTEEVIAGGRSFGIMGRSGFLFMVATV